MQNLCEGVFSLQLRRISGQKRGFGIGPQRSGSEDLAVSGVRGGAERQAEVGWDTSFAGQDLPGVLLVTGTLGSQCRSEAPPHFEC